MAEEGVSMVLPPSPRRTHPASRSPGHSRASSTGSTIDAVPTKVPSTLDTQLLKDSAEQAALQDGKDDEDDVTTPVATSSQPDYMAFGALGNAGPSMASHNPSPLRQETLEKQIPEKGAEQASTDNGTIGSTSSEDSANPATQVTFSVPKRGGDQSKDSPEKQSEAAQVIDKDQEASPTRHAIYTPSEGTEKPVYGPVAVPPKHLHSILKRSNDPSPAGSRRSSLSEDEIEATNTSQNAQRPNGYLQLPKSTDSPRRSRPQSPSSRPRSTSPSTDRTRIVGKGGYGGRQGGPALDFQRTSSSGGLSDMDMRPGYERKVGFDTMVDADDTPTGYFNFCLQVKSRGYRRTKNTRTFMCAVDDNQYSERALEWLMESLVSDGDEIVALRVLDGDPETIDQDEAREEARELMASIVQLNDEYGDRSISIVVEFVAGRVTPTILNLIYMYRPDSLTVGTRGRSVSTIQKVFGNSIMMGSCSRDILNQSPVPVVIVRPEAKVKKHLAKRQSDPRRRSYHDLVARSKDDQLPLSVSRSRSKNHSKTDHATH